MELEKQLILLEIFRENAAAKRREKRFEEDNERLFERQKNERQQVEEQDRRFSEAIVAATHEQIAAFTQRLDSYDTATVRALMENEEALNQVRKRRMELEDGAFKLPDGRSVFKTEDGRQVFDQRGVEVPRDIVAPEQIPDGLPRFGAYKANSDQQTRLLHERQEIHDFQKRVDEARETLDKSGVSAKALDRLGADLEQNMPSAVRRELAGGGPAPQVDKLETTGSVQGIRKPAPVDGFSHP